MIDTLVRVIICHFQSEHWLEWWLPILGHFIVLLNFKYTYLFQRDLPSWFLDTNVYEWPSQYEAIIYRLFRKEKYIQPRVGPPPRCTVEAYGTHDDLASGHWLEPLWVHFASCIIVTYYLHYDVDFSAFDWFCVRYTWQISVPTCWICWVCITFLFSIVWFQFSYLRFVSFTLGLGLFFFLLCNYDFLNQGCHTVL